MTVMMQERFASVGVRYRPASGEGFVDTTLERASVAALMAAGPVREFRWYKGRTFYSGWYWSATTGALVAYESRLELTRILLADFDADVCAMVAQPFQLHELADGRVRRHVPDLLLGRIDGGVTAADVKPARRLADPRVRAVFAWTAEVVELRGWRFETWSGVDPVLLANIRFLAGYRRPSTVDPVLCELLIDVVDGQGSLGGIEHAARSMAAAELVRPALLHLLWSRRLEVDLSVPLGAGSPVWRVERS